MTPLKAFVAALGAEVNTFSPLAIGAEQFGKLWCFRAGELPPGASVPLVAAPLARARELEGAGELTVVQGFCGGAQPGGIVQRAVYEGLRGEILADLRAALPVDLVLLGLHGATVAEGHEDCEGDLLRHVREIAGSGAVVAALLDPHCHLTAAMLANADLLMAYKEYPHTDIFPAAERLVDAAVSAARGTRRPVMRAADCRTIGIYHTMREPMLSVIAELRAAEADPRVIDISIAHGFPWGDVADLGTRVWATTDGDPALAAELSFRFAQRLCDLRGQTSAPLKALDDIVAEIASDPGLAVIADDADNPGGGAPSDATYVVRALREAGIGPLAAALFWDPQSVARCVAAGEGASLSLAVGGKACALSGAPLVLDGIVRRILHNATQPFGGGLWPIGTAVWFECGGLSLVLSSGRSQCFDAGVFTQMGIDPAAYHAVVVKSSQHFYASFSKLTDRIFYARAPGVLTQDLSSLPYAHVRRPIWPLDADVQTRPVAL
ncbi:MAG TPA: M81 family metallopeptidase [Rhizomicrobium sp.]